MNSIDFRLVGKSKVSQCDSSWSYKLNSLGNRFQMICNGVRRIQRLWRGYNPKLYNGKWVQVMANKLAKQFRGVHIIADTHYETVNKTMKTLGFDEYVHFYTFVAKPRSRPKKILGLRTNESCGLHILTKEQQVWNIRIAYVRARVEYSFGLIKLK
jgi:hypothetical protein